MLLLSKTNYIHGTLEQSFYSNHSKVTLPFRQVCEETLHVSSWLVLPASAPPLTHPSSSKYQALGVTGQCHPILCSQGTYDTILYPLRIQNSICSLPVNTWPATVSRSVTLLSSLPAIRVQRPSPDTSQYPQQQDSQALLRRSQSILAGRPS